MLILFYGVQNILFPIDFCFFFHRKKYNPCSYGAQENEQLLAACSKVHNPCLFCHGYVCLDSGLSCTGVKRPGRAVDHSPTSIAQDKETMPLLTL